MSTVLSSPVDMMGELPRLPGPRVHQLLVLGKAQREISTHRIMLGMAPIGGQHATLSLSLLPEEQSASGGAAKEKSAWQDVAASP